METETDITEKKVSTEIDQYYAAIRNKSKLIKPNQSCTLQPYNKSSFIWNRWDVSREHMSQTRFKAIYSSHKNDQTLSVDQAIEKDGCSDVAWFRLKFRGSDGEGHIELPCYLFETETFQSKKIYKYPKHNGGIDDNTDSEQDVLKKRKRAKTESAESQTKKQKKSELDFAKYADMDLGDLRKHYDIFIKNRNQMKQVQKHVDNTRHITFALAKLMLHFTETDGILKSIA